MTNQTAAFTTMTLGEAARTYPRDWNARSVDLVVVSPSGDERSLGSIKRAYRGSIKAEVCYASGVQTWVEFPVDYPVRVYP